MMSDFSLLTYFKLIHGFKSYLVSTKSTLRGAKSMNSVLQGTKLIIIHSLGADKIKAPFFEEDDKNAPVGNHVAT